MTTKKRKKTKSVRRTRPASSLRRTRLRRNPKTEVRELILFADNDGSLYRSSYIPILKNLAKKISSGKYDKTKAKKLWFYHADRAAKAYAKEFATPAEWNTIFPIDIRREAAEHWEKNTAQEIRDQGISVAKKNPRRKSSRKHRRALPPIPKHRVKNVRIRRVTRARKNPYIPYLIYGDARPHRAKAGRVARYYWTGYKFTTDKKYAENFPNAESAFNVCKRIRNRLPTALEFVAVQRVE